MSSSNVRSNLHEEDGFERAVEKGGPFDVGPNELDDDIGRHVRFPEAEGDPENESLYSYKHVIVAVQKDHKGRRCYRVQIAEDVPGVMKAENDLGRVALSDEVEFIAGDEGSEST